VAYQTELMSFPIKPGKESRAREWMDTLRVHHAECVATLDREAMHFESLFRSVADGVTHLSWFSVQGTAGAHVESSPFAIDLLHMHPAGGACGRLLSFGSIPAAGALTHSGAGCGRGRGAFRERIETCWFVFGSPSARKRCS
jgi:hypothetical protein